MTHRVAIAAALASFTLATPAHADSSDWARASDIGYGVLVGTAIGVPLLEGDESDSLRAAGSVGAAFAVTEILKRTVKEERPDHSDNRSFPSGHASQSFAAAASMYKHYGWQVGLPAHGLAVFVAVARVKADKHFVHDVIAGAAIGETSGWLIARRKNDKVQWLPWGDAHGGGMTVAVKF
ncbi:MAG TPA: phosphatase PAP2 family protein [Sphingomicrobium sp.]|jgi:membrane-associated phospholipid phosphatase|nr:phosphatase PAP2 family protein [Sphingomicrobium sp.]